MPPVSAGLLSPLTVGDCSASVARPTPGERHDARWREPTFLTGCRRFQPQANKETGGKTERILLMASADNSRTQRVHA